MRPRPPLALPIVEQEYLLGVLDSERFADTAPATIYATLLDEGHYHGSVRTMYRLLAAHPTRFKGVAPRPPSVPLAVWINPPKKETTAPTITPNRSLNS